VPSPPAGRPARTVADWLRWQEALNPRLVDLGLDRVREVLARMGLRPPAGRVVTVGGTNGKGSTITLIHDVLRAAGGNPGLYTSPHLIRYQERIRIGGEPVADDRLIRGCERVEAARAGVPLTYFEFGTLAAFACFAEAGCDTWLLEVGLGGRLDAVNALEADLALVTTVGLDHQDWLGDTVEAIAAEKAGIYRGGRPAFYGDDPVPATLAAHARRIGAELRLPGVDFVHARSTDGTWTFTVLGPPRLHLAGLAAPGHWTAAQYRNASLALAALADLGVPGGLRPASLNPVLLTSAPPGRFQRVQREHEWVLDVAHNPQAAAVLRTQLGTLPPPPAGAGAVTLVLSLLADKSVTGFVRELRGAASRFIVAGVADPRASTEERLREALREAGVDQCDWAATPAGACAEARRQTPPGGRIVVCGSFRLVGPALEWLGLY